MNAFLLWNCSYLGHNGLQSFHLPNRRLLEVKHRLAMLHFELFPVCCFQVVEADIFSGNSLKAHFKGQDVIMSCLGFPAAVFSAVTGYSESMSAVISAMREARVNRIVTMTSWYTERKCCCEVPHRAFISSHPLCSFMHFALCLYSSFNNFLDLYLCL